MPPKPRVVVPEILDGLPHDDPDAIASRRDLRRVNSVMGNPRWILRKARAHAEIARRGIAEIGAGDGRLAMRLAAAFPETRVTAIDLAPAPQPAHLGNFSFFGSGRNARATWRGHLARRLKCVAPPELPPSLQGRRQCTLPPNLDWRQSDLFDEGADLPGGGLLVACLILHHFEAPALDALGRRFISRFDAVAIVEPDRRQFAHHLGRLAWPFINRVTRHDMHVSINAGFAKYELPGLLGLDLKMWRFEESCTLTGARRLFAVKHVMD